MVFLILLQVKIAPYINLYNSFVINILLLGLRIIWDSLPTYLQKDKGEFGVKGKQEQQNKYLPPTLVQLLKRTTDLDLSFWQLKQKWKHNEL